MTDYTRTTVVENGEEYVVREWPDGTKYWYQNGKLQRLNGPAVEWADGNKEWWQNDKHHRLDGPACEWADGCKSWWIEGKYFNSEEAWKKAVAEYRGNDCIVQPVGNVCTCDINYLWNFGHKPNCPECERNM